MGRWPNKYVIGLTGNLAMGKSLVRRMLEHLGAYTIDAGGLAYQAMAPGAPAYKPVVQTFGTWILDPENRVDRAKLDAVSFSHPDALRRRQELTQPIVGRAIDTLIGRTDRKVVVVEAVDLLEGAFANAVDAIWVVDATPENQIARLTKGGLSEWEARKRIELQNPQQAKLDRAAVVIRNNGTPEETWKQVQAEWSRLGQVEQVRADKTIKVEPAPAEPAAPAPVAAPTPQAAPGAVPAPAAAPPRPITEVTIKRGRPRDAEQIAALISRLTGKQITRMDVMTAFGQKSYLLAEANGQDLGIVGFQVENLITRVDEFLIEPRAMLPQVLTGLIQAVEEASKDLQSEVGFFFLPPDIPKRVIDVFVGAEYELKTLEDIKVPAWREAARESQPPDTVIYAKKLRAERVLKPL